jgi:hypothetical protein
MVAAIYPGRLLKRELGARKLSANRLVLDHRRHGGAVRPVFRQ